ncbi:IclR family transcriptional regulator [Parafrankia soli]|uniref:IclR family transcriptional regulator n=2 Tax=Parafrankia soli TaxID=2599596 RepID=A0A1S1Q0Q4_9ACTN|nr:IclR family transcriptional regulator [Parafrankia soli]
MSTLGAPSILWKAFDVLGAFRADRRVLTFAEVSRASGLPKSTTHRVLAMLLEMGAVERHGHGYRIGLRIFAMGSCSAEVALRDVALPVLQEVHRVTRQTVHLAVLRSGDVVYIEKLRTRVTLPTPAVVGERLPAHCTAIGKSLLTTRAVADMVRAPLPARTRRSIVDPAILQRELALSRSRGFAVDREECVDGLACLAVPIHAHGVAVAGVSVAFPAAAGNGEVMISTLRTAAARIGRALPATLVAGLCADEGADEAAVAGQ